MSVCVCVRVCVLVCVCEIKWWPRPHGFDRFQNLGHDDLTAKHCYFWCSRLPDIDGIKLFDKDDQAAKHCWFYLHVLQSDYLHTKFWFHQHQETLSSWNNNVLQWVHHDQNFQPSKPGDLDCPFNFTTSPARPVLVLSCSLFTPGGLFG